METLEQKNKPENPVLEHNTVLFLTVSGVYAFGFVIAFFKNYAGLTFPLITIATLAVCGLFLKKSRMVWKKENWFYIVTVVLLGVSTMLTNSFFVIFFNTVGILLLLTVFMIRQFYDDQKWNPGQYFCNVFFLYICMVPAAAAPFVNLGKYIRTRRIRDTKNKNMKYVIYGILLGIPMVIFAVVLLSSADAVFSKYIGRGFRFLWEHIIFSSNVFLVLFLFAVGFFCIYTFLSALTLNNMPEWKAEKEKKNPVMAFTFTGMVTMVYLIFCGIQILFLFTGGMVLPKGYTYAEYAHQGFFQLLFVCIFNFIMVMFCIYVFQMNRLLKLMLTVFSICSYIMIISAAFRMILYISVYHLSFLRILVLWFLGMLVFLMAGVLAAIWKETFQVFRYSMIVITLCYLLFSFGRTDYWIAEYNTAKMGNKMGYDDVSYLCSLSKDAAPVLARLNLKHQHSEYEHNDVSGNYKCSACILEDYFISIRKYNHLNIRNFNLASYYAVRAADQYLK